MNSLKPTFRFKTNIPAKIHFESNEPQTGTGQYGNWYRYNVFIDNQEHVLFASKGLQDRLSHLGNLYGRDLEITKKEDENNRIYWEIKENGNVITPKLSQIESSEKSSNEQKPIEERITTVEKRLDSASVIVKGLISRIQYLEDQVEDFCQRAEMTASEEQNYDQERKY